MGVCVWRGGGGGTLIFLNFVYYASQVPSNVEGNVGFVLQKYRLLFYITKYLQKVDLKEN